MAQGYDYVIVGGGIAGRSLAARLAGPKHKVLLLEMEWAAPYHATARSAALHDPVYVPGADVAALALMSHELFERHADVLQPKASLHLFGQHDLGHFAETLARCRTVGAAIEELDAVALAKRFPYLEVSPERALVAIHAPPGVGNTIDVNLLYDRLRSQFLAAGGAVLLDAELQSGTFAGGAWTIRLADRDVRAGALVNCAGAWADQVAARCGLTPLGLTPLKRTVVETALQPCADLPASGGPFVFWSGGAEDLYCDLRRNGRVLISPADEILSQPCDAQADALDVGTAIFRFEERTTLKVVNNRGKDWAGLRTFAADRKPVIGWSREHPRFFWSGAFGGFGIECALAASALAADAIQGKARFAEAAARYGVEPERFSPERLRPVLNRLG